MGKRRCLSLSLSLIGMCCTGAQRAEGSARRARLAFLGELSGDLEAADIEAQGRALAGYNAMRAGAAVAAEEMDEFGLAVPEAPPAAAAAAVAAPVPPPPGDVKMELETDPPQQQQQQAPASRASASSRSARSRRSAPQLLVSVNWSSSEEEDSSSSEESESESEEDGDARMSKGRSKKQQKKQPKPKMPKKKKPSSKRGSSSSSGHRASKSEARRSNSNKRKGLQDDGEDKAEHPSKRARPAPQVLEAAPKSVCRARVDLRSLDSCARLCTG